MAKEQLTEASKHPEVRALDETIGRLGLRYKKVAIDINAILSEAQKTLGDESKHVVPRVEALLAGKELPASTPKNDGRLAALYDERDVLKRALDEAQTRRRELVGGLSVEFCAQQKPRLAAAVRTVRDRLAALRDAAAVVEEIETSIENSGFTNMLPIAKFFALGDPADATSKANYWAREMKEAELL